MRQTLEDQMKETLGRINEAMAIAKLSDAQVEALKQLREALEKAIPLAGSL
jgi:hypothetical protein